MRSPSRNYRLADSGGMPADVAAVSYQSPGHALPSVRPICKLLLTCMDMTCTWNACIGFAHSGLLIWQGWMLVTSISNQYVLSFQLHAVQVLNLTRECVIIVTCTSVATCTACHLSMCECIKLQQYTQSCCKTRFVMVSPILQVSFWNILKYHSNKTQASWWSHRGGEHDKP